MSRWHKAGCDQPTVVVDTDLQLPHCRNCDSTPPLDVLAEEEAGLQKPWSGALDEPAGQRRLRWPPQLPWSRPKEKPGLPQHLLLPQPEGPDLPPFQSRGSPVHGAEPFHPDNNLAAEVREADSDGEPSGNGDSALRTSSPSVAPFERPLYDNELGKNQFRLLCLDAADDGNHPIHGSLEEHNDDLCPEYETVSYAWGGQDGDYRRNHPVYLGPYWDVALQTRNCWSMLRCFRPQRGIRVLWVDAICINQRSISERQNQVAKMNFIYRNCLRVVAYLGEENVKDVGFHRRRRPLVTEMHNLPDILQRAYFSRVWVIQELVLSPAALVPIGDVDFTVGAYALTHWPATPDSTQQWQWSDTAAPWVQKMCSRTLGSLWETIQQTWQSQATDPRDKIFGILGLLQDNIVTPDYSISFSEAFIGLCGHILISLCDPSILWNAARKKSADKKYPSWVPEPDGRLGRVSLTSKSTMDLVARQIAGRDSDLEKRGIHVYRIHHGGASSSRHTRHRTLQDLGRPSWHQSISINPSTASLTMSLVHLISLQSFHGIAHDRDIAGQAFEIQGPTWTLHLRTSRLPKELMAPSIHLFLLEMDPNKKNSDPRDDDWLLILLRKDEDEDLKYRLVWCCWCYHLDLASREGPPTFFAYNGSRAHLGVVDERGRPIVEKDIVQRWSLTEVRECFWKFVFDYSTPTMRAVFPGLLDIPVPGNSSSPCVPVLRTFQAVLDHNGRSSMDGIENAYLNVIKLEFFRNRPRICDGMVEFTIENEGQWRNFLRRANSDASQLVLEEEVTRSILPWSRPRVRIFNTLAPGHESGQNKDRTWSFNSERFRRLCQKGPVRVRLGLKPKIEAVRASEMYRFMKEIQQQRIWLGDRSAADFLLAEEQETDREVFLACPPTATDELGLDGKWWQVTIM